MNRITRMLTITGLGLLAGATIGAGPAMAASSTGQGAAGSQSTASAQFRDHYRVAGTYSTWNRCDNRGEDGQDEGWWDDYNCVPIPGGHRDTDWALVVSDNDWGHGWHGHWNRPWWPINNGIGHHRDRPFPFPIGDHPRGDHPRGDHSMGDHPMGDHPRGSHSMGNHSMGNQSILAPG